MTIDPALAPPGPITAGITAPHAVSADRLPGPTYRFEASLDAVENNVPVTLDSLTTRIITTQCVVVMNPSPDLP